MKNIGKKYFRILLTGMSFLGLILGSTYWLQAAGSNTWPFTTAGNYTLYKGDDSVDSNNEEIVIQSGAAQLVASATVTSDDTVTKYNSGTHATRTTAGPDAGLALTKSGSTYAASGDFTSRVLDAGASNTWQTIGSSSSKTNISGGTEIPNSESGLVHLWHMNNDWVDSVGSNNGSASAVFTTNAKLGSHAGDLTSSSFVIFGDLGSVRTIEFWYKPLVQGGFLWLNGSSIRLESSGGVIVAVGSGLSISNQYINGVESGTLVIGDWNHVVVVLGSAYSAVNSRWLSSGAPSPLNSVDELAMYSTALSQATVMNHYAKQSAARLQVRSGTANPPTGNFVGPDGTTSTYYPVSTTNTLVSGGDFSASQRYVQYKAYFNASSDQSKTPVINSVTLASTNATLLDSAFGDFTQGTHSSTTTTPAATDQSFVGLAKMSNGGYYSYGMHTSQVFDGGSGADWNSLAWSRGAGEISKEPGMVALYHMNSVWTDSVGSYNGTANGSVGFNTASPKLGSAAGSFDGTDDYVSVGNIGSGIKTVEFWINDSSTTDGIIELINNSTYISIASGAVTTTGFTSPTIYVNGSSNSAVLSSGWNHVAVVTSTGIDAASVNIGEANNDYLSGLLDEVAFYDRAISPGEVSLHYKSGGGAGDIKFQARSGSANPPTGDFVGSDGTTSSFYTTASGSSFSSEIPDNQYFQYRAYFSQSTGNATPVLTGVTVTYNTSSTFVDDTRAEFDAGTYAGSQTQWYADDLRLADSTTVGSYNFVSQSIDAGQTVNWTSLDWGEIAPYKENLSSGSSGTAFTGTEPGMTNLWHMDSNWNDSVGSNNGTASGDATFDTSNQKLGTSAGTFDGTGDYVTIGDIGSGIKTIEFWVKDSNATDGILELINNATYVSIASSAITTTGFTSPTVYVNGRSSSATLNSGWNHVAVVTDTGVAAASVTLGEANNDYMNGLLDEVAVYTRALPAGEIRQHYLDQVGNYGLVGLWHMDNNWNDSVGSYNGTASGNATFTTSYQLGTHAGTFDGTGDYVTVGNVGSGIKTVEFWVNNSNATDGILELINNSTYISIAGSAITTTGFTSPTVYVNGRSSSAALNSGWNHVAVVTSTGVSASGLTIGEANSNEMQGSLDELAIYHRVLSPREIFDHYLMGANNIRMQVSVNGGSTWTDEGGTSGQYITQTPATLSISNSQTIQYRAELTNTSTSYTPRLLGADISYSTYPTNDPYVVPNSGIEYVRLTSFTETSTFGSGSASIRYQLSPNGGSNWYYHNGSSWTSAALADYNLASEDTAINSNAASFEDDTPGEGSGSDLRFRAFLHSDGITTVELDSVDIGFVALLTSASVSATSAVAGASTSYTIAFTTSSTGGLSSGDTVDVIFDSDYDLSSATYVSGNTGSSVSSASNTLTITLGTAIGNSTAESIVVSGILNPPYTQTTAALTMTTKSGATVYDEALAVSGTTITAGSLSSLSMTPAGPGAGLTSNYTLAFQTANSIPASGRVIVTFDDDYDLSSVDTGSGDISGSGTPSVVSVDDTAPGKSVTFSVSSQVSGSASITIADVRNPTVVQTTTDFVVTTQYSDGSSTIDTGTASGVSIASAGLTSTNIIPVEYKSGQSAALVGSVGTVTVNFTIPSGNPIPSDGKIVITFSGSGNTAGDFVFSSGGTTAASVVSGLTGTLVVASISSQTITLTRSSGVSESGAVSLTLSNMKNPTGLGSTGVYRIQIQNSGGILMAEDASVTADNIFGVIFSSPTSSTSWEVAQADRTLTWTEDGTSNTFLLQYYDTQWRNAQNNGSDVSGNYTDGGDSALWDIPANAPILSTYKVRAYDATLGYAVGESEEFTVQGGLSLTAPTGGEKWSISVPHEITWTTTGSFTDGVKVSYSTDSTDGTDGTWSVISAYPTSADAAAGTNALSNADDNAITGSSAWWLPSRDLGGGSTNVWIKVENADTAAPASSSVTSSAVSVSEISAVSFTLPDRSNTAVAVGADLNINITSAGVTHVTIEYKSNANSGSYVAIQNSSGTSASDILVSSLPFSWRVPDDVYPAQASNIRVTASASSGITGAVTATSSGVTIYGTLSRSSPVSGTYNVNDSSNRVPIVWTGSSSISAITFQYTQDFVSPDWQNAIGVSVGNIYSTSTGGTAGTYNWSGGSGTAWWQPEFTDGSVWMRIVDSNDSSTYSTTQLTESFNISGVSVLGVTATSSSGDTTYLSSLTVGNTVYIKGTGATTSGNVNLYYDISSSFSSPVSIGQAALSSGIYAKAWTVPDVISSSIYIKVTDPDNESTIYNATSSAISILGKLTVSTPGSAWTVGQTTNTVSGTVTGDIDIIDLQYTTVASPGSGDWTDLATGISIGNNSGTSSANFTISSGTFTVPDAISSSSFKIRVKDATVSRASGLLAVSSASSGFQVKGLLAVTAPISSTDWYVGASASIGYNVTGSALSDLTISYGYRKSATASNDSADYTFSGTPILSTSSSAYFGSGTSAAAKTYAWSEVADVVETLIGSGADEQDPAVYGLSGNEVWVMIRMTSSNADTVYSQGFRAKYYKITWAVKDFSGNFLPTLNVSESALGLKPQWAVSDFSLAASAGAFDRYYPYYSSNYVTTFTEQSGSVDYPGTVSWQADSDKTVTVSIDTSPSVSWRVKIQPLYNYSTNVMNITSWLERQGLKLKDFQLSSLGTATAVIYDASGTQINVTSLSDTTADSVTGAYTFSWTPADDSVTLTRGAQYLIEVTIDFNGVDYTSSTIFTYESASLVDVQSAVLSAISGQTTQLQSDLTSLETSITSQLGSVAGIGDAVTSIQTAVDGITTSVGAILEDTATTIPTAITDELAKGVQAEILNRSTTVSPGETLTVRFRTATGLSPTITVYDAGNTARVSASAMSEIGSTGIYEYDLTVSSAWGTGDYTVICQESTRSSVDSFVLSVGTASDLSGISSKIDTLDTNIDSLTASLSTVSSSTSQINNDVNAFLSRLGTPADTSSNTLFGKVSALQTSDDTTEILNYVDGLESLLGSSTDSPKSSTIFGKMNNIEASLRTIGADATGALTFAQDARGQAVRTVDAITDVKRELREGKVDSALTKLGDINNSIVAFQDVISKIPGAVSNESVTRDIQDSLRGLDQIASEKGLPGLVSSTGLQPGLANNPEDINAMTNSLNELKSLMLQVRSLLDKEVNEPVVHGWLEGN